MGFVLEAACVSSVGKRRYNNEDNFFFDGMCMEEENEGTHCLLSMERLLNREVFLAVFDGMGGENYGEKAAFAAAQQMQAIARKPKRFFLSEEQFLQKVTAKLNAAVVDKARELLTSRMGTTLAMLYFTSKNVYSCNVGDSRVFRLRDKVFTQLSEDHVLQRPMPAGRKAPLTQHLGMDPGEILLIPCIAKGDLQRGDVYLICSDGLSDMVEKTAITDILLCHSDVRDAVPALVDAAMENGGRDNITVILCRVR